MTLTVGATAPNFSSVDQNGQVISLQQFLGKKIALYFYPKDDTPTCTAQACNLRDNHTKLLEAGIQVIGISVDPVKKHKKFEEKYGLPFPLVADESHEIVTAYGVWGEKKFMGKDYIGISRTTFLINESGKIDHIFEKPVSKSHSEEIVAFWGK